MPVSLLDEVSMLTFMKPEKVRPALSLLCDCKKRMKAESGSLGILFSLSPFHSCGGEEHLFEVHLVWREPTV